MSDKPEITLREHLANAGRSKSPRKLAAVTSNLATSWKKPRTPAQLEALAKARARHQEIRQKPTDQPE